MFWREWVKVCVLEVETNLDKLIDLKDQLVEEAVRLETIEDSQTAREILGAELMDLVTPCPVRSIVTSGNLCPVTRNRR